MSKEIKKLILPITAEQLMRDPEVSKKLTLMDQTKQYHNFSAEPSRHTLSVMKAAERVAAGEGLDNPNTEVVKIAALFHDIEHPLGTDKHEVRSGITATQILRRYTIPDPLIQIIRQSINETRISFDEDGNMVTRPTSLAAEILCDADISSIGLPFEEFWPISEALRAELGITDNTLWIKKQIEFLNGITWHTQAAKNLYDEQRLKNIEELRAMRDIL